MSLMKVVEALCDPRAHYNIDSNISKQIVSLLLNGQSDVHVTHECLDVVQNYLMILKTNLRFPNVQQQVTQHIVPQPMFIPENTTHTEYDDIDSIPLAPSCEEELEYKLNKKNQKHTNEEPSINKQNANSKLDTQIESNQLSEKVNKKTDNKQDENINYEETKKTEIKKENYEEENLSNKNNPTIELYNQEEEYEAKNNLALSNCTEKDTKQISTSQRNDNLSQTPNRHKNAENYQKIPGSVYTQILSKSRRYCGVNDNGVCTVKRSISSNKNNIKTQNENNNTQVTKTPVTVSDALAINKVPMKLTEESQQAIQDSYLSKFVQPLTVEDNDFLTQTLPRKSLSRSGSTNGKHYVPRKGCYACGPLNDEQKKVYDQNLLKDDQYERAMEENFDELKKECYYDSNYNEQNNCLEIKKIRERSNEIANRINETVSNDVSQSMGLNYNPLHTSAEQLIEDHSCNNNYIENIDAQIPTAPLSSDYYNSNHNEAMAESELNGNTNKNLGTITDNEEIVSEINNLNEEQQELLLKQFISSRELEAIRKYKERRNKTILQSKISPKSETTYFDISPINQETKTESMIAKKLERSLSRGNKL